MPLIKWNYWPKLGHQTDQNQFYLEFPGHRLPDQFGQNGYNLVYKNPNPMKLVEKFPQDIDLQHWWFDQNPETKETRSVTSPLYVFYIFCCSSGLISVQAS